MGVLTNAALAGNLDRVPEATASTKRDNYNALPLSNAVISGEIELVRYLDEQVANHVAKDDSGYKPLFYSVSESRFEIFRIFLSHAADDSSRDYDEDTVLHLNVMLDGRWSNLDDLFVRNC